MVRFIHTPKDDVALEFVHAETHRGTHALHYKDLRRLTGGIFNASRYLATVRRAITMPCSPSMSAILLSDKGFFGSSAPVNCTISARIAVEEASPPASVATWLPKKYFNSNMPCGVSIYF